ncbi:MerR family transcriptional regulator [Roseateles sp. GG27B]
MPELPAPTDLALSGLPGIAAVERDLGISKDTLRVWERRYGFPAPLRDAAGERVYPAEQVQRLRLLKRLLDSGHRPGRVVPADIDLLALLALPPEPQKAAAAKQGSSSVAAEELERYLDLLRAHDVEGLRRALSQALLRMGLGPCVMNLMAPLTTQVGACWMRGELEIFEEHVYTESLQQVLRQAVQAIPPLALAERPRVLLTTLVGESHGLGLLMVEAMLTLEGCQCLSLGVQTPVDELARAAVAHRADIVALSFSGYLSAAVVQRGLTDLRALLDPGIDLWAGGRASSLQRRAGMSGVSCIIELVDVASAVARWRATQTD